MNTQLFDKTDKGREEISTRHYHLAARMRTLLLLVDGKSTVDQLLHKVAGLGLDETAITELLDQQFIREADVDNADQRAVLDALTATAAESTTDLPINDSTASNTQAPVDTELLALHQFFSATIKSTLGLRGFPLQLKADRAASLDDFKALRAPYLAAILKASGPEMERILADRLDVLIQQQK